MHAWFDGCIWNDLGQVMQDVVIDHARVDMHIFTCMHACRAVSSRSAQIYVNDAHVRVHVCTRVCACVYMSTGMYVCMYVRLHVRMRQCTHA